VQNGQSIRRALVALGVATSVLALSACGSSGNSSSSTTQQGHTSAAATKSPVVVLVTAPVNSQISSYPQYFYGVKAYADAVNAAGGLDGHPLKVTTCDNQFNPNVMANCARSAASAGAVAMMGNGPTTPALLSILKSANIAWLPADPFTPLEYQAPNSFVSTIGYVYLTTAEVALAVHSKCPSVAVWYGTLLASLGKAIGTQLAFYGIKPVLVGVPATATDLSAYVAQTTSAKCLLITGVADPQQAALGVALGQLGHKFQQIISTNALTTKFASQAPSAWNGTLIANTLSDPQGSAWAAFRTAMQKNYPSDVTNPEAAQIWPLANIIGNVVSSLAHSGKSLTGANVQAALNSSQSWSAGGVIPNVDYTKSLGVKGFPRLVSPYAAFQVVKNGAVVGDFGNGYVSILPFLMGQKVTPGTFGTT
jgi:branched-chain amino acid transport system substrate-binding protein